MFVYTVILHDFSTIVPRMLILKVFKDNQNALFYKHNLEAQDGFDIKNQHINVEKHSVGDW